MMSASGSGRAQPPGGAAPPSLRWFRRTPTGSHSAELAIEYVFASVFDQSGGGGGGGASLGLETTAEKALGLVGYWHCFSRANRELGSYGTAYRRRN